MLKSSPKSIRIRDKLGRTPFHRALAQLVPFEIRHDFHEAAAPLGSKTGLLYYAVRVKFEYHYTEGDDYDSKKRSILIQELKDEGVEVEDHGDDIDVKVNHLLWKPRFWKTFQGRRIARV